jgi:hypothetical protein
LPQDNFVHHRRQSGQVENGPFQALLQCLCVWRHIRAFENDRFDLGPSPDQFQTGVQHLPFYLSQIHVDALVSKDDRSELVAVLQSLNDDWNATGTNPGYVLVGE